jgi:hypothetical protein
MSYAKHHVEERGRSFVAGVGWSGSPLHLKYVRSMARLRRMSCRALDGFLKLRHPHVLRARAAMQPT